LSSSVVSSRILLGLFVGCPVGAAEGSLDGILLGLFVGSPVGASDG
jgi:hypothetical protein